jgi:hypothetical protein
MKPPKDPQIVTTSKFNSGDKADYLVFSVWLGLLELKVVAKVPEEGERNAPVYVNFKLPEAGTSVIQTPSGQYPELPPGHPGSAVLKAAG